MAPTFPWQIVVGFLIDVNSENRQLKAENRRLGAQLAEAGENYGETEVRSRGVVPGSHPVDICGSEAQVETHLLRFLVLAGLPLACV